MKGRLQGRERVQERGGEGGDRGGDYRGCRDGAREGREGEGERACDLMWRGMTRIGQRKGKPHDDDNGGTHTTGACGVGTLGLGEEILVSKYLGDGVGILGYRYKPGSLPGSGIFAYDHPAILSVD